MEQIKQAWEKMGGADAFQKAKAEEEKKRKFDEDFKNAAEEYVKKHPGKAYHPYSAGRDQARAHQKSSESGKLSSHGYSEAMQGYKY
jgi:hypothetical protein